MKLNFAVILLALAIGFGAGFLAARPVQHYVHAEGVLMYNERTGHICNGLKDPARNLPAGYVLEGTAPASGSGGFGTDRVVGNSSSKRDLFDRLAAEMNQSRLPFCGEE